MISWGPSRRRGWPPGGRTAQGAILLEVLIALTIFVIAAAVVGSAMRSSMDTVMDIRLAGKATDLAQSVLAELSIGALELVETSPRPFAEDEESEPVEPGWTYEIAAEDIPDAPGLKRVTVTVAYDDPRRPHVCRLTQWMLDPNFGAEPAEELLP